MIASLVAGAALLQGATPCFRPSEPGTMVQGSVRVCPGSYRIPDPDELGVIVIASSGTRLDLTGVNLTSGDSTAAEFIGYGVVSRGLNEVEVIGGNISGYRYGLVLEGGRGHLVSGINLSGSRSQALRSTPTSYDEADWLDIFRPDTFEPYGGGLLLKNTDQATVTRATARGAQNGIVLFGARESLVADNDVSHNSGWGISLWRAAHNIIVRNDASYNVRCESASYSRGCDSAAILLRERSDSNLVADNDLRWSGDGFFLSGHRPLVNPSVGNVVLRNDASHSYHNAFESTFSDGNAFLENVADSSRYGFWLGYSTGTIVRGNVILGTRESAIAIEHGSDNELAGNTILGGRVGIHLFTRQPADEPSRGYRVDDNVLADLERAVVLANTSQSRIRGNLFDRVSVGLTVDEAGRETEVRGNVFLQAHRWFIAAPRLDAGNNFWGTPDAETAQSRVTGDVVVLPWRPASEAGF